MANLSFLEEIRAPARIVGAFFMPYRMDVWYGTELDLQIEVEDNAMEFRTAQKIRLTGRLGKRAVAHTAVVTAYDRARLLEWQFQDAYGVRGLQRWEIEATRDGARVRMVDHYQLPGRWGASMDWLFTRHAVRARDRRELARLKHYAERAN